MTRGQQRDRRRIWYQRARKEERRRHEEWHIEWLPITGAIGNRVYPLERVDVIANFGLPTGSFGLERRVPQEEAR